MRSPFDRHQVVPGPSSGQAQNEKEGLPSKSYCSCWSTEKNPFGRVSAGLQFGVLHEGFTRETCSIYCNHHVRTPGFRGCSRPSACVRINERSAWAPSSRRIVPARFDSLRATESRGSMSMSDVWRVGGRESSCSGGAAPQVLSGRLLAASQPPTSNFSLFDDRSSSPCSSIDH